MNREIISDALNRLDDRHISETEVFAPELMHSAPERTKPMNKYTSKRTTKRFVTMLIAACLVLSLGIAAYAAWSIHTARQQELRDDLNIVESNTESYVEYDIPDEQKPGVTILSSINDGVFQKVYVNVSPVEESELPGADAMLSIRWNLEGTDAWGLASPYIPDGISAGPGEVFNIVREHAYDAETKTLSVVCSVDIELLDKALAGGNSVNMNMSAWLNDEEIRSFGSAALRASAQEMRYFDFGGVTYFDAEHGKEIQLVGLELSPTSAVWKLSYEGDAQYHADKNQEMLVEWGIIEDTVCINSQIIFADGTSFSTGGVASNPYENGTVNCFTSWGKAININSVERIVLGDLVLWENK